MMYITNSQIDLVPAGWIAQLVEQYTSVSYRSRFKPAFLQALVVLLSLKAVYPELQIHVV